MQIWPVPIPIPIPIPCPAPPAGIPEWVKILITALKTLSRAPLAPLRASIQHFFAMHRTHVIIADEIDALALTMSFFIPLRKNNHTPDNPLSQKPAFNTERFDYAYKRIATTFTTFRDGIPSNDSTTR